MFLAESSQQYLLLSRSGFLMLNKNSCEGVPIRGRERGRKMHVPDFLLCIFLQPGMELEEASAQIQHKLLLRCNQKGAEKRNTTASSCQITTNSLVSPSHITTLSGDKLNSCWWPLSVSCLGFFSYLRHTFIQCTRVHFDSAAEATTEIHLTTSAHCTSWKTSGISALPIRSAGRFAENLCIQQMEICDAFSNRCVLPATPLKKCHFFQIKAYINITGFKHKQ